ncbi:MAG: SDR family oxidoreductase [Rhizobiaceae bacterium]|nr:SDR family oxidoreductase [Rhizobiaceae bacterium]
MSDIATQDLLSLNGKVALVTGAGRGIGQATAVRLASAGAAVALCDRSPDQCEETAALLSAMGAQHASVCGDLCLTSDISKIAEDTFRALGRLDILVNNAALRGVSSWDGLRESDWDRYMAVNSKAPFFMSQAAAKIMAKQGGGSIVSIASTAAIRPVSQKVDYNMAKAAVVAMTRSLAVELGKLNIRVNAVGPGATNTRGGQEQQDSDSNRKQAEAWISRLALPVGFAEPDDIARAVLYFASPASNYVTGQVLYVDAGYLAG